VAQERDLERAQETYINLKCTYTSRERHARSGLYYYRARWYSPALGRFLTPDPIGHLGGMNLYAYSGMLIVLF
jgi:RHS repeat-associated protein